MSNDKAIIGGVVALGLPKPDLMQTDPKKGDYVYGKDIIPSKVSDLENDAGYLTEHQDISGKMDADKLPEAINTALAQAKASGEFNGADGADGKDGKTPVKGMDYYTDADTAEMVDAVLEELPIEVSHDGYTEITGQRGVVDIAVTEEADGTVTMVNTLEGGVSETIQIIPDENGNPMTLTYNGVDIPIAWTEAGAE